MSRAIEQKKNSDGFVKPGELVDIRAGAGLSLHDRRVFNLLIDNAWAEIGENKTHRIAVARLRGPRHESGDRVADSVTALMTSLIEVPATLDGKPAVFKTQLLGPTTQTIDENSPHAVLEYKFPDDLRKVIQESRYWGRIKSHVMFAFTSKYALALYEAVCLRANLRVSEQEFGVDDFRELLGVEPGKLTEAFNLKKWALDPAVAEVNALSDFNVEIEPIREGGRLRGKLTGFRLRWEKKSQDEWRAVLDELLRPKLGRKARLRGLVESVAADRPAVTVTSHETPARTIPVQVTQHETPVRIVTVKTTGEQAVQEVNRAKVGRSAQVKRAVKTALRELTEEEIQKGYEAAVALGVRIDKQAAYADWRGRVAEFETPPENPVGHFIAFCKTRARGLV